MDTTKITVKIYTPLLTKFSKTLDSLHIKRDSFLNAMIKGESAQLAIELNGRKQSGAARKYIAGALKRLGTTTVNIVVEKSTADNLNQIVDEANLVRDAFINRLMYFLLSSDRLLQFLELPVFITGSNFEGYVEPMPTSPMSSMKVIASDPLYYLRLAVQENYDAAGIYTLSLPKEFNGFACFLPNDEIPGTEENQSLLASLDELMKIELDSLEENALSKGLETK